MANFQPKRSYLDPFRGTFSISSIQTNGWLSKKLVMESMGPESGGLQDAYMKLKFLEIFSPFFNGTELQQAIGGRECAEWPQS